METFILLIIVLVLIVGLYFFSSLAQTEDDFRYLIEPELKRNKLKFVSSTYPGQFSSGPFKKFSFRPQILFINDGAIPTGHIRYRKILATNLKGKEIKLWVEIDKDVVRGIKMTFDPPLDELED